MDFNAIIKRVVAIITKPNEEWQVIKGEQSTVADLFVKYAVILAAIPAVAGFLGYMIIGFSVMGITIRPPFQNSLIWMIVMYVFSLVGVYLLGFIIDALAPSFGASKNLLESLKVAVYSYTAMWVAGIIYIIPSIAILAVIAGFYSLYLLFLGIKIVKAPPQDKAAGYFIVTIIIQIIIAFLIGFMVSSIAFGSASAFMR